MSKGTHNLKTYCDAECAALNGCTAGGVCCDRCGLYFCADDIGEDGLCARCEREHERNGDDE